MEFVPARDSANTMRDKIEQMFLTFNIVNASGAISANFKNPFALLEEIKISFNGVEQRKYNHYAIQILVQEFLMRNPKDILEALHYCRSETSSTTITGETVPVSSTLAIRLPLFWIFSTLENWITNVNIARMKFEFSFRPSSSTLANEGSFVTSGTTANCYTNSILSFTEIGLEVWQTSIVNNAFLKLPANPSAPLTNYDVLSNTVDFSSTSNFFQVKTKDFPSASMCQQLFFAVRDRSSVTAYNDTDCQKMYSGYKWLRLRVKRVGDSSYTELTNEHVARSHQLMVHEMAGKPLTNSIILESTDLNRYYLNYMTMWDFRQIDMEREHIVAGGIDLGITQYEFIVSPAQVMGSDCELIVIAVNYNK